MKKCRRCTKPAVLHITEIKEGEARALHLCESCAQEYLGSVGSNESPEDSSMMSKGSLDFDDTEGLQDEQACPHCGITFRRFRSQGRLGCPHDYEIFRARLIPLLESIHSDTQHVGKCPQNSPDVSQRQHQLIRLRSELKSAIENEEYERAARIRDSIQELESDAGPDS